MTLAEEKQYYEWLRFRLFRSVFKGTNNKATWRQIDKCNNQLAKLYESNKKRK